VVETEAERERANKQTKVTFIRHCRQNSFSTHFAVELDLWRVGVKGCVVRRREAGKDSKIGVRMEHDFVCKLDNMGNDGFSL
jgi:hypothetical protein